MPDLRAALGACRFYNCTHLHEPGCGVRAKVQGEASGDDTIAPNRYRIYEDLFAELSAKRSY